MSANIKASGDVRQLDAAREPDEVIDDVDVADHGILSRLLTRVLREVATLKRTWTPARIDFEDVTVDATGTTTYTLRHGLNGRVRFWVVDWSSTSAGAALARHADTDANTLVLVSYVAGTATIRVEASG